MKFVSKKDYVINNFKERAIVMFFIFQFIIFLVLSYILINIGIIKEELHNVLKFVYSDFLIFVSIIISISLLIILYIRKEFFIKSTDLITAFFRNLILLLLFSLFAFFTNLFFYRFVPETEFYLIVSFFMSYVITFVLLFLLYLKDLIDNIDPKNVFKDNLYKTNSFKGDILNISKYAIKHKDI